ncbi:MAG: hypothetical protein L0Y36_01460 [Planctomycetales bacterium]|nr:hypothetical protein [Planctomycetales bacterium]
MTISGWIFMLISWAVILGLFIFSMVRTLRPGDKSPNHKKSGFSESAF